MKKLKDISKYHFGIGIVTILLQFIFPISTRLFLIGLATIFLSRYEKWIVEKMKSKLDQNEINQIFQNFKIINIVAYVIFGIIIFNLIAGVLNKENALELIKSDPLVFINSIVILSAFSIFMLNREIEKMKLSIK